VLDAMGWTLCMQGKFEPLSIECARRIMSKGGTFVDVGANFGIYTATIGRLPGVRCVSIDASSEACAKLVRSVVLNKVDAIIFNIAVGSNRSLIGLENPSNDSLGNVRVADIQASAQRYVGMSPLMEILEVACVQQVRLLKMDIEGYEVEALRGLDLKSKFAPDNLITEFYERREPGGAGSTKEHLEEYWGILRTNGYSPFTVTGAAFDSQRPLPESNIWWRR
jgi:FkbM family methyltransferase